MKPPSTVQRRAALAAGTTSGRPLFPTHPYAGSDKTRAEAGKPGHCELCAQFGHVVAHPTMGCGDVGCDRAHEEKPAGTEHRPPFELSRDECVAELGAALYGWIPAAVAEREPGRVVTFEVTSLDEMGDELYAAAEALGDDTSAGRHIRFAAEQFDAGYAAAASESERLAGLDRTFYQAAVAYARQAYAFDHPSA